MGRYNKSLAWAFNQFTIRTAQDIAYKFDTGNCKPSRIIFCLTLRCNIKCKQCGIWRTPKKKELTLEEWKKVLVELKNWLGPYRVQIAGGEIFLRNDIVEFVKFAHDNGILIGMVSNGTLITEEIARNLVEAGLDYFDVSLDGIKPETHDEIRGIPGVYDKAMAAINYVKHYAGQNKTNLGINVATIVMGRNMHELTDIVRFVEEKGLSGVLFNPLGPACDSNPEWYKYTDLWPKEHEFEELDKILDQIILLKKQGARILNSTDQFEEMKKYFRNPLRPRGGNCMVGVTNLLISCDGEVHLCFHLPPIGTVNEPLAEIWKSGKAKNIRKSIKQCNYECSPGNFIYRRSLLKDIQRYLEFR